MPNKILFIFEGEKTEAQIVSCLQTFFETDKGKLYVSYPMVEALKHICDYETFKDLTVECKKNISYKNVAVLSAFPVFLPDYYGNEEIKKCIE